MKLYENRISEVWEDKNDQFIIKIKPYIILVPSVISSIKDCIAKIKGKKFDIRVENLKNLFDILTADEDSEK